MNTARHEERAAPAGDILTPYVDAQVRVALAGNPNSGKTTAFNKYTGARQHVGNYPGVTVDRKEGVARVNGEAVHMVDLPGTYSLTAYSQEELVARMELTRHPPLAVIDIVDSSALERNLLLAVQLMEMGMPLVLACNMMDEARQANIRIDLARLSERLGVPVVATVARSGEGLDRALAEALKVGRANAGRESKVISYGPDLDPVLMDMENAVREAGMLADRYRPRWLALKILEGDGSVLDEAREANPALSEKLEYARATVAAHIRSTLKTSPEAVISDYRYGFIKGVLQAGVITRDDTHDRLAMTDKLDKILAHAILGPALMLALMYGIFLATFSVGAYPQGWVESFFGWLGETITAMTPEGFLQSLLVSGIIDGVGGVLSFVPLIMIMFLFIAFMEDSGYMARIAYMVDRVFRAFGLHGVSVMPYIISGGIAGGCAIPGAMATRTLRSPKEKLATLLTLPFMACGAKLPVFLLLAGAFFAGSEAKIMMIMSLSGWAAALLTARLLRSTVIRGQSTPFVMELPPYRLPTLSSLLIHTWERTWMYIKKAGTVLVAVSILIWAALTFPALPEEAAAPYEAAVAAAEARIESLTDMSRNGVSPSRNGVSLDAAAYGEGSLAAAAPGSDLSAEEEIAALEEAIERARMDLAGAELRNSLAGRMGTALEPLTAPAGFDWRVDVAILGGIAAKEALVATLGTAYSLGDVDPEHAGSLAGRLAADPSWSPATALALMLFVLLYCPCFVALMVIRQEAGSWRWVAFSVVVNTAIAFLAATAVYQVGIRLLG